MFSAVVSRLIILLFGTLYPAYASYKAVKTRNVKEYVKWMMYWIVFALFSCAETFTDVFLCWFPFYYELKIIIVLWLLSPATKGSSILYRKFVHPMLSRREQEIDEYINKAKEQGYSTVLNLGTKGVNYATSVIMQTAIKGGGGLVNQLKKSYSLSDLTENEGAHGGESLHHHLEPGHDETDDVVVITDPRLIRATRARGYSPRRSASGPNRVDMYFPEVDVDVRQPPTVARELHLSHIRSTDDVSSGYSSAEHMVQGSKAVEGIIREGALVRTASVGGSTRSRAKTTRSSTGATKKIIAPPEGSDETQVYIDPETDIISIPSSTLYYLLQQRHLLQPQHLALVDIVQTATAEEESDSSRDDSSTSGEFDDAQDYSNHSPEITSETQIPTVESPISTTKVCLHEKDVADDTAEVTTIGLDEVIESKCIENADGSLLCVKPALSISTSSMESGSNASLASSQIGEHRAGRYNKRTAPTPPSPISDPISSMDSVPTEDAGKPIKATLILKQGLLKKIDSVSCKEIFVAASPKLAKKKKEKQQQASKKREQFSRLLRIPKRFSFWGQKDMARIASVQTSSLTDIDQLQTSLGINKRASWYVNGVQAQEELGIITKKFTRSSEELNTFVEEEDSAQSAKTSEKAEGDVDIQQLSESPSRLTKRILPSTTTDI